MSVSIERAEILSQIDHLRLAETPTREDYHAFLRQIGREDITERLTTRTPMIFSSAEYLLPRMMGDGGLGALDRDDFLEAVRLGIPAIYFGLLYSDQKMQVIHHKDTSFWQTIESKPLPSPEELGFEKLPNIKVFVNGEYGPDCEIPVWSHPLSTDRTPLIVFQVPGVVYPGENNSNARMWNNVVLGFGHNQVIRQMLDQGFIDDISFTHTNESAMVISVLALIDYWTKKYGDTPEAYDKALAKMREKDILTNHTLVPAAEATFTKDQCYKFIFSNLTSDVTKKRLWEFIDAHGGQLKLLDLAFHFAGTYNGVSVDHAKRAADIFHKDFAAVTNGVYEEGWALPTVDLLQKYGVIDPFGLPLRDYQERLDAIPLEDAVRIKQQGIEEFRQYLSSGERRDQFGEIVTLPKDAIILGDARRFAKYKRRWMMFQDKGELERILTEHPRVHIVISGKAHPNDHRAMEDMLYVLESIATNEVFRKHIHFLPDWDTTLATALFHACSGWLNNPSVGDEACGTSGMKAGLNMGLCESTMDGFFAELDPDTYYAIRGDTNSEEEFKSFYRLLEQLITDAEDPAAWFENVKRFWRGDFLKVASAARMKAHYLQLAFPQ